MHVSAWHVQQEGMLICTIEDPAQVVNELQFGAVHVRGTDGGKQPNKTRPNKTLAHACVMCRGLWKTCWTQTAVDKCNSQWHGSGVSCNGKRKTNRWLPSLSFRFSQFHGTLKWFTTLDCMLHRQGKPQTLVSQTLSCTNSGPCVAT